MTTTRGKILIQSILENDSDMQDEFEARFLALTAWLHDYQGALAISDYQNESDYTDAFKEMFEEIAEGYDDTHFEHDGAEYWVLSNDEANDAWDKNLESYIDECILPELPESYRNYFDRKTWKKAARYDGRGHSLNGYDGSEKRITFNETVYCIYRTN